MASDTSTSRLLALPDPCLLAVMQCCADDMRSVTSAATAHSRLQRAAVEALSDVSAGQLQLGQARVDSVLLYLAKHGQHVHSLALCGSSRKYVPLHELPPSLTKLDSLQLEGMTLQLQPGSGGAQGVLSAAFPLTRLDLSHCSLLGGEQGLAAALAQLSDLQHLSLASVYAESSRAYLPTAVLSPHLTKRTSLKLHDVDCYNSSSSRDLGAALQPLQALTRLADLQLSRLSCIVTADALSGVDQLTRMVVSQQWFEPRALAGKTQLQHLTLVRSPLVPGTDVAQLLSELQHLTQLTHLDLADSCGGLGGLHSLSPPPAAYASLTASSKLQHLDFHNNTLPSAAWQYMCPPRRTLPHLRYLDIIYVKEADRSSALPDTSALVSCCPGLQSLTISIPCSTAQLAPLSRLAGLQRLVLGAGWHDDLEGVQALCQLTGLQDLDLLSLSMSPVVLRRECCS